MKKDEASTPGAVKRKSERARGDGTGHRLFLGTFLSDYDQKRLGAWREQAGGRLSELWHCRLKWVRSEQLHLTWIFIGSVGRADTERIPEEISLLLQSRPGSVLNYDRLELWPNARQARLLVLVPGIVPPEIPETAKVLKKGLASFLQKQERDVYKPHITLIRFERGFRAKQSLEIPDWLIESAALPVEQSLDHISLIESHLDRPGGAYESLRVFPFGR